MKETKSLKAKGHDLASGERHIEIFHETQLPTFAEKISAEGLLPLKPTELNIFQVNVGKMCNQVCSHCHVDAGPDRKEIMTRETMDQCLAILKDSTYTTVDLTGGAPEMNPDFRYFVEEIRKLGKQVIVRCNLTIIVANKKYYDLPEFFKKHNVEVVSSLPHYTSGKTDRQRGDGVFDASIKALNMLNAVGYGKEGSGLTLNLVYNPSGAFLPGNEQDLERDFKKKLKEDFDIEFNSLFAITNLPVSRFLEYLIVSENYEEYMEQLIDAYNPAAAHNVMCRNTISISWDGYIFDCDFNQMMDLKVDANSKHISEYNAEALLNRNIIVDQHCFGCTAGAGSSCGGQTAE
jgi:radical SAM/Cys-rich protein